MNLISDPWILVRTQEGIELEVSMLEFFSNCHTYSEMAGESAQQDIAVFRFLQAVSTTLIERFTSDGKQKLLPKNIDDILERWQDYWEKGQYPREAVETYLEQFRDSFWMDSPEGQRRFMQTPAAKKGTSYGAAKLIGTISESSNKFRLFQSRMGESKNEVDMASAARWLLYLNGFDDTSSKKSKEYRANVPKEEQKSVGAGWLGKIGLVYPLGENLFESLMLNSVLLKDGDKPWSDVNHPYYEEEKPDVTERREVPVPENLAAILTLPSRRIWLDINDRHKVQGFSLIGGDFFSKENAFSEQNTLWSNADKSKKKMDRFIPKRHNAQRQIWRDFQILTDNQKKSGSHLPGVVAWIALLDREEIIPNDYPIRFITPAVIYGDKDFMVDDLSTQSLTVRANVLGEHGEQARELATEQIEKIERLSFAAGLFMKNITLASGGGSVQAEKARRTAEDSINTAVNLPYLDWLATLDPEEDLEKKGLEWEQEVRRIANKFVRESSKYYLPVGFIGRKQEVEEKKGKRKQEKEFHVSIPEAENLFWYTVAKLYPKPGDEHSENNNSLCGKRKSDAGKEE